MKKIPTCFKRGPDFKVIDEINPKCDWVFEGAGVATEKFDGTNVRLTTRSGTLVRVEKRCNPTKKQKKSGIIDPWYTDTNPHNSADKWILDAANTTYYSLWPDGEHCCEAIGPGIQGNPLGLYQRICIPFILSPLLCEISSTFSVDSPYVDQSATIIPIAGALTNLITATNSVTSVDMQDWSHPYTLRSFKSIREYLTHATSRIGTQYRVGNAGPEGIVFHHPDGRMAKIKYKDFSHE